MSVSPFDHALLSGLLGDDEVSPFFSADSEIQHMLRFEEALALAEAQEGVVPSKMADGIVEQIQSFVPNYDAIRRATQRDGVIGVEFSSVWRSWGAEVQIIEALPHLVPNEDESVSKQFERAFRKRGIEFSLGVRFQSVTQDDQGVHVTLENGAAFDGDILLVAVGRGPVTANLGFEEVGVAMDRGFVLTDERLRTNVPGVYAVGDIVPGLQLAHRGFMQGIFVAEEIAGLNPVRLEESTIPRVTYSDPEVASVGITEAKAVETYGQDAVVAYDYNLAGNGKSHILETSGSIKVVRVKDGPVVGVHMIGARVGELIGEAQLAVGWEAYPEDIAPYIHAHPTQNEALGEAFLALAGKPLHAI